MIKRSIVCRSCNQTFQADANLSRAFCLYCGAENNIEPQSSANIESNPLNLSTDPATRREQLMQMIAANGGTAALARDRLLFWGARFESIGRRAERYGDKFIEFISLLIFYSQNYSSRSAMKRARKDRDRFFNRPPMQKALHEAIHPQELLLLEFNDAAEIFLRACREDKHYSSRLFALVKMKDNDVATKAAEDIAIGMMGYLCQLGMIPETDQLIRALHRAYPIVFDTYPDLLDETIARQSDEIRAMIYRVLAQDQIHQEDAK